MAEVWAVQEKATSARRNVVVKAVVDQTTHRAALLLADSSCLLVSLTATSTVAPITVPPPCSNACFLRLQACGAALACSWTSGSSRKFVNGFSPSSSNECFGDTVERRTLKIGNAGSHASRVHELSVKESVGKLKARNHRAKSQGLGGFRREVFVVLSRPALGGSCTDLCAWSCVDPAFSSADIEIKLRDTTDRSTDELHNLSSSRTFARLDAPHGLAVKMAASINVLVVYSSSAGKFWVIAGKWYDEIGEPAQPVMSEGVFGVGPARKLLVLMKCAVLRCYGPIYSMLVSPLHLFLGESKGIRVWTLRPLIKPGFIERCSGQAKPWLHATPEQGSYLSNNTHDCERCARGDRYQHALESRTASRRIYEKTINGNGANQDATAHLVDNTGVAAMKQLLRKGLCCTDEFDVGSDFAGIGNYRKPRIVSVVHSQASSSQFWSLSDLQDALDSDCSVNQIAEDCIVEKMSTDTCVIKVEDRNGASCSCSFEHGGTPTRVMFSVSRSNIPQGDTIASRLEAHPSNECTGNRFLKIGLRPRELVSESHSMSSELGAKPSTPQLTHENTLQQTGPSVHGTGSRVRSKMSLESPGMCFVALSGKGGLVSSQSNSYVGSELPPQLQVVDIERLSLKEYVILDSKGELHLLSLHDVLEERKLVALFPILNHLRITMHVSCFVVPLLPPPSPLTHRDCVFSADETANRKLWVSDGMYSVHAVILSEEKPSCGINSITTQFTLSVSQAVFMKDRLDVLVTGSGDTGLVMTEAAGTVVSGIILLSCECGCCPVLNPDRSSQFKCLGQCLRNLQNKYFWDFI